MSTVKVRLSGDVPAVTEALRVLFRARHDEGFEMSEASGPYPNRREPGYRVYVTLRFPPENADRAGRRTAAKQSAAPLPQPRRHLP
jgi:hypothetical protein